MQDHSGSVEFKPLPARHNISAPSFHKTASHYYKCFQDFKSPNNEWSPVPYELLCIAIELELKSRHLEKTPGQLNVKDRFWHNLTELYEQLPAERKTSLTPNELRALRKASLLYGEKAFLYVQPRDAVKKHRRFPVLAHLDAVAKKLLQR